MPIERSTDKDENDKLLLLKKNDKLLLLKKDLVFVLASNSIEGFLYTNDLIERCIQQEGLEDRKDEILNDLARLGVIKKMKDREFISRENDPTLAHEGHWLAAQYVNTLAKKKQIPPWESIVREIHSRVIGPALLPEYRDRFAGQYRTRNAFVINAGAEPTQWMDLHSRMSEYGREMDERIKTLNPGAENIGNFLDQIAWGHYELSIIHPFIDGNGRTSRQSMDLLCKHFGIKSITLGRVNKPGYIQALSQVDQTGNLDHFTLFLSAQLWREYAGSKNPIDEAYTFHILEKIKILNINISNSIKHN